MFCNTSQPRNQSSADTTVKFDINQTENVKTACLYIVIFQYLEFCEEKYLESLANTVLRYFLQ